MATDALFNEVLKRYTPFKMIMEEVKQRNWFIESVQKKTDWVGGTMEIPIELASGGSLSWGSLVDENDIADGVSKVLTLTSADLKECWGAMKFTSKDLARHSDLKRSYLELLPGKLTSFANEMSEQVSNSLFGDGSLATVTVASALGAGTQGIIRVDSTHFLKVGMKVVVDDGDSAPASGYITAIDANLNDVKVETTRAGGTQTDLTAYTVAQGAKLYIDGAQSNGPTKLQDLLLSAANGGSAQVYNAGFNKAIYPALQAINVSGSAFTQATLLKDYYNSFMTILEKGKGNLNKKLVIPFSHMGIITNQLEARKEYVAEERKAGYGFTSLKVMGPDGAAEFVAVRGCQKTKAFVLDMETVHLCGNKFFKRDVDANGNEFYVKRATTGKVNIVDTAFEAEVVITNLSHNGIIHSIPSTLP